MFFQSRNYCYLGAWKVWTSVGTEISYQGKKLCVYRIQKYPQRVEVGQGLVDVNNRVQEGIGNDKLHFWRISLSFSLIPARGFLVTGCGGRYFCSGLFGKLVTERLVQLYYRPYSKITKESSEIKLGTEVQ